MAAAVRAGLLAEGADVVDVGMVGTEMLYWTVGDRGLDGGAMITASHNPKAYTGVKLVREGALALSGDTGITRIRDLILEGLGDPAETPGEATEIDVYEDFWKAALEFIDAGSIKPMKVVVDGGNGMAGPHGRAAARSAADRADRHLLGAGRQLPRPRAEPAAAREPAVHHRQGQVGGRRPRHRLGRRRRPLLLHRRSGRVHRRRLPHGTARQARARQGARRRHPLRRPRLQGRARHGRASTAAPRTSTGSATRS